MVRVCIHWLCIVGKQWLELLQYSCVAMGISICSLHTSPSKESCYNKKRTTSMQPWPQALVKGAVCIVKFQTLEMF